ncbi:gamma-butyrobetaine hydroxylase-like domain-containing protein [Paraburkholderia guartelaensis]|uniref:gamma-butyrobetaine hydroxylase-like domain-containing protein n=1 Tax=Paraburkholderia guartelaensis TaxID=2546446 RepID=UPI002AB7EB29|nr:gamma-butyrobetaine hydroxylase-like domain-containing protein [Paraburkholderia guartelaensis]
MKTPLEVRNDAATRTLMLRWPAGETQRVDHARLRAACPCAACRRVRLDGAAPEAAADVTLIAIEPMGYGVQLAFSDGHARGIYPWPYLEQLGRDEAR